MQGPAVRALYTGSPPRVWGILTKERERWQTSRFTPTSVGNTSGERRKNLRQSVHPHECGEYWIAVRSGVAFAGSPPRVWGIRGAKKTECNGARFTPTSVGNTSWVEMPSLLDSVHPHECGEYYVPCVPLPLVLGSPPRVWGIRQCRSGSDENRRFTPTSVGNTKAMVPMPPTNAVHPHECGEYTALAGDVRNHTGSPPRVWGIPLFLCRWRAQPRFTPTSVGNTGQLDISNLGDSVHPHECGEYNWAEFAGDRDHGSPPRVWGIRCP